MGPPSSSSERSGTAGGASGSTASRSGELPLPPYIHERPADPERYQTVYARAAGSAAAPTAGLHFTPELLGRIENERITLHVGLDTFGRSRPTRSRSTSSTGSATPSSLPRGRGSRRPTASSPSARRRPACSRRSPAARRSRARSDLFITPGFAFRRVDALLTNFHLPRTTLLALVMAFAGVERTRELYGIAIRERYRFYSFGDAMLVL